MEGHKYVMVLLVAMSSMWVMSMAQSSSPGISSSCTTELVSLQPCLDYITGNSSTPTSSCCSQLGSMVRSSPECLCQVLNGGASGMAASLNINQTQALTLPNACNVQTPPLSSCNNGISSSCTTELVSLQPCLDYITGNSSTPTSSCCSQLGSMVRSSPECLCQVLNGGASGMAASLNINQTQALTLPNACNVQTPPLSSCNNVGSPVGSPFGSPSGSGTGMTPTGDSSDAKKSKSTAAITLLFGVLYVASHALAF